MNVPTPHYLLFSEADRREEPGGWRFALCLADGTVEHEAADVEPEVRGERLDLLTVVRALESLDEPAQVTLVGCSPYVRQGLRYGLPEWRDNGWRWEYFGQMVPVRNGDLWQRFDRVLRFHQIQCRYRRIDCPHVSAPKATAAGQPSQQGPAREDIEISRVEAPVSTASRTDGRQREFRLPGAWTVGRRTRARWRLWRYRITRRWTSMVSWPRRAERAGPSV
ncbi:MAG: hypothetical protein HQ567_05010 [Candidatus Nealsonbacteria bacterium]|nr:hypothetical protein [Candidatus Nealsonbacteria bacterium]